MHVLTIILPPKVCAKFLVFNKSMNELKPIENFVKTLAGNKGLLIYTCKLIKQTSY